MYMCVFILYMANKRQTIKIILYPLYVNTACINMYIHIQCLCISIIHICMYVHMYVSVCSYMHIYLYCHTLLPLPHADSFSHYLCIYKMHYLLFVVNKCAFYML